MNPNFFPTASSLFFVIFTFIIAIPPYFCRENDQYATCGNSFDCANIRNIGYPFWGEDRPNYCGRSGFQLTNCQGDVPLITIDSISYRVLSMNELHESLTVSRADLYEENCPTYFFNATLDSTPFVEISTNQIVTLLYGCTLVDPGQVTPIPSQFNCTVNGTTSINYFMVEGALVTSNLVLCRSSVRVPVNETSAQALGKTGATTRDLQVALASGFGVEWNANNSFCDQCKGSSGWCGSNPDSNSFACFCADGVYDTRCNTTAQNGPSTRPSLASKLATGLSISGAVVIFIIIFCYHERWFKIGKKEEMDDKNVEAFLRNHGSLTSSRYAYSDIKKMTNSFSDKLGEGGHGSVFKGKLSDGRLVAVKVLNDASGDGVDFVNEVSSISRTSHVNIVALLGFCLERNKRALVYEFMPNKSLDKFIHNSGSSLDWQTLYRIAVGTARGLEYLHRGCNTRIVHFDIKPENILLDEEFCPKISDFGLAKLCQRKKSIVSMLYARGTPGYIAPEVFSRNFGEVSHKSDVYSYGMMVSNMIGVEKKTGVGLDLDSTSETCCPADFIYEHLELGKVFGVFQGLKSTEEEETTKKMAMVSLWCIQMNPLDRPSMSKVLEMLEGSIESLQVPPKPFLFSPIRANQDSCSTLSGSCEIASHELSF
ncbi:hypothetical protein LguiB_033201 [Lonicera macranthoides]